MPHTLRAADDRGRRDATRVGHGTGDAGAGSNRWLVALLVLVLAGLGVGKLLDDRPPAEPPGRGSSRGGATAIRESRPVAEAPNLPQPAASASARPPDGETRAPASHPAVSPSTPPPAVGHAEVELARTALALYQQGRVAEACERYEEILRRVPDDTARRNLGVCLARLGLDAYQANQLDVAGQRYQRALQVYPDAVEVWVALAVTSLKAGDHGRARSVLDQALRKFPDHPDLLYVLAEAEERQGRTREAVDTLRRLLAAHPAHARGRSLLASLEREQKVEREYWSQESAHFLVRYEGAEGIDLGRSVVDILESAYESIGRDLGAFPKDKVQVGIYARQVLGQVIGIPAHYVRGAFDGRKLRLNLAESVAYSNDLARLVRHEYAHAVIHLATTGRSPIWLHEGLAQVMEPRPASRYMEISVPRQSLTLRGIERLGRTMDPVAFTAGYQLMHIAVEFLVDRGGMPAMRTFLARLGKGEDVAEALRGVYGLGPEEIEARLLAASGRS